MRIRKFRKLMGVFMLPLLLSSCWDYMEIERRGYVMGIAIDKVEKKQLDNKDIKRMQLETSGAKYAFTAQIPIIARSQHKSTGLGGTPDVARHWNITVESNAFFEAGREFSTILDYPPYYPHLQSIVISEAVAKEDISKVLDMFFRDPEMRRRTKLFITPDKAKDVLNVVPKIDDYSASYLRSLPGNAKRTSRMAHRTDLGRVSIAIHSHSDYVLPRVIATKFEIKDSGVAVFKENKMVGWLDEIDTNYLNWITDTAKGGTVSINMPGSTEEVLVVELRKLRTKQRPMENGDSVTMVISCDAKMNIAEIVSEKFYPMDNHEFIDELEAVVEQHIKEHIEGVIAKVQQEYGADIFFFKDNTKRYAPKAYAKMEKNWDEEFKNMKVDVQVKVEINQYGLIK